MLIKRKFVYKQIYVDDIFMERCRKRFQVNQQLHRHIETHIKKKKKNIIQQMSYGILLLLLVPGAALELRVVEIVSVFTQIFLLHTNTHKRIEPNLTIGTKRIAYKTKIYSYKLKCLHIQYKIYKLYNFLFFNQIFSIFNPNLLRMI